MNGTEQGTAPRGRRRKPIIHGSPGGAGRHRTAGEEPCEQCRVAARADSAAYRGKGPSARPGFGRGVNRGARRRMRLITELRVRLKYVPIEFLEEMAAGLRSHGVELGLCPDCDLSGRLQELPDGTVRVCPSCDGRKWEP